MNFRKISAAFLALTMTAAALPNVSAEYILTESSVLTGGASVTTGEAAPASDFKYQANEDGVSVTITDYKGNGGDVVIPSEIEGKKVTSIGGYAFETCRSLTSVEIPGSVTSIGNGAFRYCTSLISVEIPDSVTIINDSAFWYCTSLTAINVDEKNVNYSSQDGVLFNKDKTVLIQYPEGKTADKYDIPNSVTSIGEYAFRGCTSLTSVEIPESVIWIGGSAFDGCTSLTSVTIPDSVTSIGRGAFEDCTSLTSVEIPESVIWIGGSAFDGCTSLTSVTIPDSVTSIGRNAFYDCTSLTSVEIPGSVTSIGDFAFSFCTSLTSVEIPNSVTSIGDLAFWYCTSLTAINVDEKNVNYSSQDGVLFNKDKTVLIQYPEGKTADKYDIPNSVTSIGEYAFRGCTSLTSVTIPHSVTSIDWFAFEGCTSLTSVTIPDGVTSIGNSVFSGCTSLTSVTIPDSVTIIGIYAFSDCTSLTSVTIPNNVTWIGTRAFCGCTSLTSVEIPASVTEMGFREGEFIVYYDGEVFHGCSSLKTIHVDEKNTCYSSADGILFNKDKTTLIQYPAGKTNKSYIIPNSVTSIEWVAFSSCTSLTSVTIPDSVTSIGDKAFENCTALTAINVEEKNVDYSSENGVLFNKDKTKLIQYPAGKKDEKYEIPNSVTIIDDSAFYYCTSLTSVTIPDSVTSIGDSAFFNCTSLTSVTIPNSVTSIGDSAFADCTSLTSVIIPDSVTSIGGSAFADCTSLTIYGYENSYAQTYAVGNEIPFKILGKEAEINKGTGIIIENPNLTGKTLEVKTTSTTGTEITYNITLKDKDGNEVQPTGSVTVRVPLPNGWTNATVSRKEADGTFTDMKAVCENGYMVFTTDHFSEYVLKQKPAVTLGDLNSDEKININDVKIALRGALNNSTLTEDQKIAADVNEDTKVNISDVKIILKAALNGGKL